MHNAKNAYFAGRIDEAEALLREDLERDPDSAASHSLLGRIAADQGKFEVAVTHLNRAHQLAPNDAETLYHFGRALLGLDDREERLGTPHTPYILNFTRLPFGFPSPGECSPAKRPIAIQALRRCIHLAPDNLPARGALAHVLLDDGEDGRDVAAVLGPASADGGLDVDCAFAMARLALRSGDLESANAFAVSALGIAPGHAGAWNIADSVRYLVDGDSAVRVSLATRSESEAVSLACILLDISPSATAPRSAARLDTLRAALAEAIAQAAIAAVNADHATMRAARLLHVVSRLAPDLASGYLGVGFLLFDNGYFELAERAFDQALAVDPDAAAARRMRHVCRVAQGHAEDTADALPAEDRRNLGEMYCRCLDLKNAILNFEFAADQEPDNDLNWYLLAEALYYRGEFDKAERSVQRILEIDPAHASAAVLKSSIRLSQGRPDEAWPLLEKRFSYSRLNSRAAPPPLPRWQGEELKGRRLLVWREEGIGDEIRFSACLPNLIAEHGASAIAWECSPRLVGLYRRSFSGIEVLSEGAVGTDYGRFDFHLPEMSMPLHCAPPILASSRLPPFLVADPERVAAFQDRLRRLGPGPKVGFGWKSLNRSWRKQPYSTELAMWRDTLPRERCTIVNLQVDIPPAEVQAQAERLGMEIHTFPDLDLRNDIDGVAALIAALDAVVAVRCWLVYLAGALGTPTFCATTVPNPLFMEQPEDPFSRTTRVYIRPYGDDWAPTLAALGKDLGDSLG